MTAALPCDCGPDSIDSGAAGSFERVFRCWLPVPDLLHPPVVWDPWEGFGSVDVEGVFPEPWSEPEADPSIDLLTGLDLHGSESGEDDPAVSPDAELPEQAAPDAIGAAEDHPGDQGFDPFAEEPAADSEESVAGAEEFVVDAEAGSEAGVLFEDPLLLVDDPYGCAVPELPEPDVTILPVIVDCWLPPLIVLRPVVQVQLSGGAADGQPAFAELIEVSPASYDAEGALLEAPVLEDRLTGRRYGLPDQLTFHSPDDLSALFALFGRTDYSTDGLGTWSLPVDPGLGLHFVNLISALNVHASLLERVDADGQLLPDAAAPAFKLLVVLPSHDPESHDDLVIAGADAFEFRYDYETRWDHRWRHPKRPYPLEVSDEPTPEEPLVCYPCFEPDLYATRMETFFIEPLDHVTMTTEGSPVLEARPQPRPNWRSFTASESAATSFSKPAAAVPAPSGEASLAVEIAPSEPVISEADSPAEVLGAEPSSAAPPFFPASALPRISSLQQAAMASPAVAVDAEIAADSGSDAAVDPALETSDSLTSAALPWMVDERFTESDPDLLTLNLQPLRDLPELLPVLAASRTSKA